MTEPTFAELTETPDWANLAPLDRLAVLHHELGIHIDDLVLADATPEPGDDGLPEQALTPRQQDWVRDGVVIRRGLIDPDLCDAYTARWLADHARTDGRNPRMRGGYPDTGYEHVPEMRDLLCHPRIAATWEELFPVGTGTYTRQPELALHLCLSGMVSTQRAWHQDDYLNPPYVWCWYGAVWIALGDIDEHSGPFQYVPGSHAWPLMRRDLVGRYADPGEMNDPRWPATTQRYVVPACEAEIAARDASIVSFTPAERGDVLFWHGRLLHRGADPSNPADLARPALIGHYSDIGHRPDMPPTISQHVMTRSGSSSIGHLHTGRFWRFGHPFPR